MIEASHLAAHDANWAQPLYARQIAALGELAEAGLRMALEVERRLAAGDAGCEPQTAIAGFARVSRAVRLSFLLQSKLIKALEERERHRDYLAARVRTDKAAQVSRIVERIARRQDLDEDDIDRLVDETTERLDHDDIYGEVLSRRTSDLVAAICKDLGLAIDWPALSEEAWLQEEMALPPLGEAAQDAQRRGWMGEVVFQKTPPNVTRLRRRGALPARGKGAAPDHPS